MATEISFKAILSACSLLGSLLGTPAAAAAPADLAGAQPQPGTLFIAGEHVPPASFKDGDEVTGRETEKIREMLARAGIPYQIDILPWKRGYMLAQRQANTCIYSTSRTPERESQFKWVGPTDEAEWVFIGRPDHKFQLRTLEDARPLRIGTYHGDARDEFLRARGFQVEPVQNDASNPKKLMLNRIDVWAIGMRVGSQAPSRFPEIESGELVPLLAFHKVKVYLACNPALPDTLVEKMNTALDGMRRDGTFTRLERKYALLEKRK